MLREELADKIGEGKVFGGGLDEITQLLSCAQWYEGGQIKADEMGNARRTHWSV